MEWDEWVGEPFQRVLSLCEMERLGTAYLRQTREPVAIHDTCPAGYQPDVSMRDLVYEVGKGPAIHAGETGRGNIRTVHHHKVREWLIEAAVAEGIPFQSAFMHGGTDAKATAQTRSGIPSSTIGLPRRYSHSPVEAFDLKDLEGLVGILVAAIKSLDTGFNLHRV